MISSRAPACRAGVSRRGAVSVAALHPVVERGLKHTAGIAVALGLALAPAPAFAVLPEGFSGPQPTELDSAFQSKLDKLQSLAIEAPPQTPVVVEAERKPLNYQEAREAESAAAPAPGVAAPAPVDEEEGVKERADIRQAAIEAATAPPVEGPAKAGASYTRKSPTATEAPAAAPSNAVLIGGAVAAVAVAAAAAAANKGEEPAGAAPAAPAPAAPAPEAPAAAAPPAAESSGEPATPAGQ